jgi:hypothetical protein
LLNSLPKTYTLDLYFHHHSIKLFETLIREQAGYYHTFIIMPEVATSTPSILAKLDPKRTYLLDVGYKEYKKEYSGVFQNYEKDLYTVLASKQECVLKYKRLFLLVPEGAPAKNIVSGFAKFTKKAAIWSGVISEVHAAAIKRGDAFVVLDNNHFVTIVKGAKENGWELGRDIGIISYNETGLKSVIGNGITTITTDYETMGKTMADMVVNGRRDVVGNPFIVTDRNSF